MKTASVPVVAPTMVPVNMALCLVVEDELDACPVTTGLDIIEVDDGRPLSAEVEDDRDGNPGSVH